MPKLGNPRGIRPLYALKSKSYKKSQYLSDLINIEDRCLVTKLRTGCSKLKSHRFLSKKETNVCPICNSCNEDSIEHLLFHCENSDMYKHRDKYLTSIDNIYPRFKFLSFELKVHTILELSPLETQRKLSKSEFSDLCVKFLRDMYKCRLECENKKMVICSFQ